MIYKQRAVVKEVYLGNKQISALYIGIYPIWRSREYMEGAAIIVLTSDALLSMSDGVTYTVEGAGLPLSEVLGSAYGTDVMKSSDVVQPVVYAEPYMRHIAPMLASLPMGGVYKVVPKYYESDVYGTGEVNIGTGIHESDGISAPGGVMILSPIASSIEEVKAVVGAGGVIRLSPVNSAIPEVYMSLGEGAFDRDLYTADMLCIVPIEPGGSVISDLRHGYEALISAKAIEAPGTPKRLLHTSNLVYGVQSTNADGVLNNGNGVFNTLCKVVAINGFAEKYNMHFSLGLTPLYDVNSSKAPSHSFECISRSPTTAITEVRSSKADISSYSTEEELPVSLSLARSESGASENADSTCSFLPGEETTPVPGAGEARNAMHSGVGLCVASMTTEIYIEPDQSDFDSTLIDDMDVLNVTDIDVMEIKI